MKGLPLKLFITTLIVLCCASLYAQDVIEVKNIRHWSTSENIRIVIDISGQPSFTQKTLTNPERLFIDIANARIAKGTAKQINVSDKLLKSIRLGAPVFNTVRVVFDLETSNYDFKIFTLEDPSRIVVEIFPKNNSQTPPVKQDAPEEKIHTLAPLRRIVLDPGHGGHDPGAVGPTGLYEKDVVLDVAIKTRNIIKERYPHIEVHLTRETDVFIPIAQRASIANKLNADLFVSIHANASPNKKARGIETYLLNWTDDEEALRVAARENAISLRKMKEVQNELSLILASLERESKRDESVKVAGYIQNALVANITTEYPKVINHGVKQAMFYVLVDAKMPSALVELSFISNPEEENLLRTDAYRAKLAHSIADGINLYFASLPPPKIIAERAAPYRKGYDIKPAKYSPKKK